MTDSDRAAADSWQTILIHIAVALGYAVAGWRGWREVVLMVAGSALLLLFFFAALFAIGYASAGEFIYAAAFIFMFVLYGAAGVLGRPPPGPPVQKPDRVHVA